MTKKRNRGGKNRQPGNQPIERPSHDEPEGQVDDPPVEQAAAALSKLAVAPKEKEPTSPLPIELVWNK